MVSQGLGADRNRGSQREQDYVRHDLLLLAAAEVHDSGQQHRDGQADRSQDIQDRRDAGVSGQDQAEGAKDR